MKNERVCACCHKELENLVDGKDIKIIEGGSVQMSFIVCRKHFFDFFLVGQYRFLHKHQVKLSQTLQNDSKHNEHNIMIDIIKRREQFLHKRLVS